MAWRWIVLPTITNFEIDKHAAYWGYVYEVVANFS